MNPIIISVRSQRPVRFGTAPDKDANKIPANTNPAPKTHQPVHIRWMIRRDMPEVLNIEKASFDQPWQEEDFLRSLRQRNCIGMVAENSKDDRILGYMIYELHKDNLEVTNFAVHPDFRRQDIGQQMVAKLVGKLSSHRRTHIKLNVRETNLNAQLFFRNQGFRANQVLRNFYEDTGEDAYAMAYQLPPDPVLGKP